MSDIGTFLPHNRNGGCCAHTFEFWLSQCRCKNLFICKFYSFINTDYDIVQRFLVKIFEDTLNGHLRCRCTTNMPPHTITNHKYIAIDRHSVAMCIFIGFSLLAYIRACIIIKIHLVLFKYERLREFLQLQ